MDKIQKAKIILKILNKKYPKITVPLNSRNVFTLLISVLLSAQCTDVNVNNVTKNIYPKYYKPHHFQKLGRKQIEKLIKKIGIFRIKAKSIYNLSNLLIKNHAGKVPKTFEELEYSGSSQKAYFIYQKHWLKNIKVKFPKLTQNWNNYQGLVIKLRALLCLKDSDFQLFQ